MVEASAMTTGPDLQLISGANGLISGRITVQNGLKAKIRFLE